MIPNGRFSIPRELGLIPGKYTVAVFTGITTETKRENNQVPGNAKTCGEGNGSSEIQFRIKSRN